MLFAISAAVFFRHLVFFVGKTVKRRCRQKIRSEGERSINGRYRCKNFGSITGKFESFDFRTEQKGKPLSVRCERKTEKTRKFKHYQQVYGDFGSEASGQGSVCDDQHRSGIHLADTGFSRICGDGAGDPGMSLYNGRV